MSSKNITYSGLCQTVLVRTYFAIDLYLSYMNMLDQIITSLLLSRRLLTTDEQQNEETTTTTTTTTTKGSLLHHHIINNIYLRHRTWCMGRSLLLIDSAGYFILCRDGRRRSMDPAWLGNQLGKGMFMSRALQIICLMFPDSDAWLYQPWSVPTCQNFTLCTIVAHPCNIQILVALSPLLALGYVLMSAFEDEQSETLKRKKKSDFQLEGHAE